MKLKIKRKQAQPKVVAVMIGDILFFPRVISRRDYETGAIVHRECGHVKIEDGIATTCATANPNAQLTAIANRPGAVVIREGDSMKVTF